MGKIRFWSIVAILFLAVSLAVPAGAADITPSDHHIAVRQAHLAWTALETELQMNAALTYASTLYNTNTARMAGLLAEFRDAEAQIPAARTDAEVDSIILNLRKITRQFQSEVSAQMSAGQGSSNELGRQISLATSGNPFTEEKKNLYWSMRSSGQLSDLDSWAGAAQAELTSLNARGYDTTKAQRALDLTTAKRPELQSAFELKDEVKVNAACNTLYSLSSEYVARAGEIQQQVPDDARIWSLLDQADRIVGKADRLNTDTTMVILDIGAADTDLSRLKTDIVATKRLIVAGKLESAKKSLLVIKKDYTDLAREYRGIASTTNLPADLSEALNMMAVALDNAADRMGES
ncbi:hypothetical protein [uncultured Methanoregula sp.]|uniref:hypothetical protein n=1 Tax=uncultured Methanoregula sp. TaxID=1005933 RepID=UPI002AAB25F4|nr:hypothetical protein [uncultured Methanoregula sp.]